MDNFLQQFEEKSKVQQLKSKTGGTRDGKIINKQEFIQIMQQHSQRAFSEADSAQLEGCLSLTPQYSTLFSLKLVQTLTLEINNNNK